MCAQPRRTRLKCRRDVIAVHLCAALLHKQVRFAAVNSCSKSKFCEHPGDHELRSAHLSLLLWRRQRNWRSRCGRRRRPPPKRRPSAPERSHCRRRRRCRLWHPNGVSHLLRWTGSGTTTAGLRKGTPRGKGTATAEEATIGVAAILTQTGEPLGSPFASSSATAHCGFSHDGL